MREKIYILIIEDYDMALEGLISIVREHLQENILSYHIESARSIAEAWHILDAQGRNFDLILTIPQGCINFKFLQSYGKSGRCI